MKLKNFDTIFEIAKSDREKRKVVIVGSGSAQAIGGGFECLDEGLAMPVFVGDKDETFKIIKENGWENKQYEIVGCEEGENPCEKAAQIVNDGYGDCMMKGFVETADFLRPIFSKKYNLKTGATVSLVCFAELPDREKIMAASDPAILTFPDTDTRMHMVENMIQLFHALGDDCPSIGLLSALEIESKGIPDTIEDAELVRRWREEGAMAACNLAGPISYDLMMSKESAAIKGYDCPWCGDFDGVIAPNIVAANILCKTWYVSMKTPQGAVAMGAKVPLIITSRSMPAQERLRGMAMAVAASAGMKR